MKWQRRWAPIAALSLLACGSDGGAMSGTESGTGAGTGSTAMPMPPDPTSESSGTSSSSGGVDVSSSSTGAPASTGSSDETTGGRPMPVQCDGEALTDDVFVASEVYLLGAIDGECIWQLMAHWADANSAVSGFSCERFRGTPVLRPTDGRLLYVSLTDGQLREFHCDVCPIASVAEYPAAPSDNDTVLPTMCDPGSPNTLSFRVAPDGSHLYQCFGSTWYDEVGAPVYDGEYGGLLHLGHDGLALTPSHVVDLASGSAVPVDGLPVGNPLAIRADALDGFTLVMRTRDEPERWHVAADGTATLHGAYPALPEGVTSNQIESALDGCGNLFQLGRAQKTFDNVLVRRVLDGTTEVVYSEADDPLLEAPRMLVTGP